MLSKLLLLFVCGKFVVAQDASKIVGPLYVETVNNITFYEKLVYAEFLIALEEYTDGQSLLVSNNVACGFPQTYSCPLKGPIEELAELLRPLVTPSMTLIKDDSALAGVSHDLCSRFTPPVFPSLHVTADVYESVYKNVEKCDNPARTADDRIRLVIQDYAANLYKDKFVQSFEDFSTTHPYNMLNLLTMATLTSLEETLNFGGFLHQFAEKTRFEDAVGRCKFGHVLPPSLITTEHLQDILGTVSNAVSSKGYELAVSATPEFISSYWSIPTVDCAFHEKLIFSVAFGVPVKKLESQVSLHKLSSLPFHATYQNTSFTCMRTDFVEEKYVQFESKSKRVVEVGYSSGQSLYRPVEKPKGFLSKVGLNLCASSILSGTASNDEIYLNCPLECTVNSEGDDPFVVQQISSDTFVISAATLVPRDVTFNCPGNLIGVVTPPVEGAVKVSAPCGCSFSPFPGLIVEVEMPCRETGGLTKDEIIPFEISKFRQRGSSRGGLKFIGWP